MKKDFKQLISLGSVYSLGSVMQKALSFAFIPIYTTFLTTKDYGIVAMMSVTVGLIGPFIRVPAASGFVRHYYTPGYEEKRKEMFFNCVLYVLIQSALFAILFYCANHFFAKLILNDPKLNHIVKIYAFILLGSPVNELIISLLRIQKKAKLCIFVNLSKLILSAGLIIYLLTIKKMGVLALVYGNLFTTYYGILILSFYVFGNMKFRLNSKLMKPILSYGYPLVLSSLSLYLIEMGDRYVLRIYDSLSTVGLYSFAYRFAGVINIFLVIPLKYAVNPIIFEKEKKADELRKFISRVCTYYYIIAVLVCLFLSVFSRDVIQLMAKKKEFWVAWIIVPVIAYSYVHYGLRDLFGKGMVMAKKSVHAGGIYVVAAVINLGLNFLLIPYFGVMGAAFATLSSYLCLGVLSAYYSFKFYNLKFELKRLLQITGVGAGVYLLSLWLNYHSLFVSIPLKLCLIIAFPFILYFAGIFTEDEKIHMRNSIRRIRL